MKRLDRIGLLLMSLIWIISYILKHNMSYNNYSEEKIRLIQLTIDYFITFGYCIGTALISIYYGKKEKDKITKHLFYGTITILNLSIVGTYLIDLVFDPIFGTTKVIWAIIITSIISLCVYLFKRK